ncbi:reverse transcriptase family protein [Olivibacter sp. 47]|uniref:reverse transcriptase family protein n=1 Tax=Olivibacter sp. 47 TaxID=3056486 RepID=UPI0025A3300A|nr:reverse transcriptase family protein [Olivibacter sp. 47]MDM8173656.1 reverse transcriptase family protein [Olivibacter sp. 47]
MKLLQTNQNKVDLILLNLNRYYYLDSKPKLDKHGNPVFDKYGRPRTRDIYPSTGQLKKIQKTILHQLLSTIRLPDYAFGGVKKRDNILNAKRHQGNKYFFNTDLRGYYPGITNRQVFDIFVKYKFALPVARLLTKLTTYKGMLPQGTHTSPYIANLVFTEAGTKLQNFSKNHELTFTTFVDDITFSSKRDFKHLIPEIIGIITSSGFRISHNKTFYQTKDPKVTQIIVKNNCLCLDTYYHKKIEGFDETERSTPKAIGTINYFERVKK